MFKNQIDEVGNMLLEELGHQEDVSVERNERQKRVLLQKVTTPLHVDPTIVYLLGQE